MELADASLGFSKLAVSYPREMRDRMSSRTSRAVDSGRVVVKEIVKEPVKEAVREALAENEKQRHTEERRKRIDRESTERESTGGNRRISRSRTLLGLAALAAVTLYARRRGKAMMDSWMFSDGISETGKEARTGTVSDVSRADTSERVAVESHGGSESDDTETTDENSPP